jgi:hypothetical protein
MIDVGRAKSSNHVYLRIQHTNGCDMKTTVNIPEKLLKSVMKRSGSKTIREAVVLALEAYERRDKLREITKLFGTFKDFMTPEDLREMRGMRDKRHDLRRQQLGGRIAPLTGGVSRPRSRQNPA